MADRVQVVNIMCM